MDAERERASLPDRERGSLPPDLLEVLRDPSIIDSQDQAVFESIGKWARAPSTTVSPLTGEEWERAWIVTARKLLAAEAALDASRAQSEALVKAGEALRLTGYSSLVRIGEFNAALAAYRMRRERDA